LVALPLDADDGSQSSQIGLGFDQRPHRLERVGVLDRHRLRSVFALRSLEIVAMV